MHKKTRIILKKQSIIIEFCIKIMLTFSRFQTGSYNGIYYNLRNAFELK